MEFIKEGTLFTHIWVTCYETIVGFLLGTIIGGAIAVLLWSSPTISKIMDPYLVVLNSLPKVALAPIIIFWVGNGTGAIIVITLLISLVTTIISVLTGFNEVDTGKIIKQPCSVCGKIKSEAHHPDYSKPLEVIWFCRSHHKLHHARTKFPYSE